MYKGNSQVELRAPKKSRFDLSHEKRISTRMGRLTPVLCLEVIPGDVMSGSTEILLRLAPLLSPIYDSIILYMHFFFVPNRLLWDEWEDMITAGRLGVGIDPVDAPIPPYVDCFATDVQLWQESTLADYLGVPTTTGINSVNNTYIDLMPFAAYQKVWLDYYRDRNYIADDYLTPDLPMPSGEIDLSAVLEPSILHIRTRDWMKEYFTASLPFTQRGTEVLMPLAGTGDVTYMPHSFVVKEAGGAPGLTGSVGTDGLSSVLIHDALVAPNDSVRIENIDEVTLTASSVSINDLRSAVRLQEWLERNAVAGSRYVESIQAHFAVKPQDSRLQRAEFLGGGRIPVKISEVVTTAYSENEAAETVPAGNLQGHGVTYGNTNRFNYYCPEHGFIMGIMSIMVKPSYYQGLPRMFRRATFLDYPWPTFAKLGEQEVHKWELYADNPALTPDADGNYPLFGYQSRYSDWKQVHSSNHGAFRTTLLFWTLTRDLLAEEETSADLELGEDFVKFTDSVQDRIFAVNGGEDNFWCYVHNQISVKRALPYFGTPTL